MPVAEIITIGTEILLGEIIDTNAPYIARCLRELGIDIFRKTSVGDNPKRIARAINQATQPGLDAADIVITTGGLGPTVDDPTRAAVALAVGVDIEYRPELWEQIQARFRRYNRLPTENNRKQAYIPKGAIAVENPVGTAPAFIVEIETGPGIHKSIIALPGVPREMEYLMVNAVIPYLKKRFALQGIIKARVLHTVGAGESLIDDRIDDLERLSNPTVGLAAHSGQVDIRITAKAESETQADAMIQPIEDLLRQRLGNWIYGVDAETLEDVSLRSLQAKNWHLVIVEAGLGGELTRRLAAVNGPFIGGEVLTSLPTPAKLVELTASARLKHAAQVGLGVAIYPGLEKQDVHLVLITPGVTEQSRVIGQPGVIEQPFVEQQFIRPYGGPPESAPRWAYHHSLDILRNL